MTLPVDLSNLREMTDGDTELEKALFEEFSLAGARCIAGLEASLPSNDTAAWKSHAHAFKGAALNLGANRLGELCKQAQDGFELPQSPKMALLTDIRAAFSDVKKFLETAA